MARILQWRSGRVRGRTGVALLALGVGLLFAATTASASVTGTSLSVTPSTTLAAAHPNVTMVTNFSYSDSSDSVKSLQVFFPAGLLGNPSVVQKCSSAQLASDSCPAGSKIGSVSVTARALGLPVAVTAPGDVYAVTPTGSEPARIGIVVRPLGGLLGKTSMSGPATIRIPGDFGLTTTFNNLPKSLPSLLGLPPVPIEIDSMSLTLDGLVKGGTAAFMTNPTSCTRATTTAVATSYESSKPSAGFSSFTPSDCAHVPFNPGISFSFGSQTASTPSSVTVTVSVPAAELPRRQSHVLGNIVLLPQGTAINPGAFVGLASCTDTQLNVGSAAPATCPAASQLGTLVFTTPLLGSLPGQVYFGTPTAANPVRLFVQINVHGLYAKLVAASGFVGPWIATTLVGLPQAPFTTFALTFHGGPNALLMTPPCGTSPGIGVFIPWSGTPPAALALNTVKISQTSTGAACPPGGSARRAAGAGAAALRSLRAAAAGGSSSSLMGVLKRALR